MDLPIQYVPHSGQRLFHNDRWRYRYRGVFTGKRGGKTLMNARECLHFATRYPGCVGWLGEPNYPMVYRILIPALCSPVLLNCHSLKSSPLIKNYNEQKHQIQFINNSVLWLGSLDDPESDEGLTLDYFGLDEARLVRHFDVAWQVLTSRLSGNNILIPGTDTILPPRGWVTTTPTPEHTTLWDIFATDSESRHQNSHEYHWRQSENTYLTDEYLDDQDQTVLLSYQRQAYLNGEWADEGMGSYEYKGSIHCREEYPLGQDITRIIYFIDWGWTNPFAIAVHLFDSDGRMYVVDEFYKTHCPLETMDATLTRFYNLYGKGVVGVPHDKPENASWLRDHGHNIQRYSGKRDDGFTEMGGRFFIQGDGLPRIFVHPRCKNWIWEVGSYVTDIKDNDHLMDCTRGACMLFRESSPTVTHAVGRTRKQRSDAHKRSPDSPGPVRSERRERRNRG